MDAFLSAECSLSGAYHLPFACLSPVHHLPYTDPSPNARGSPPDRPTVSKLIANCQWNTSCLLLPGSSLSQYLQEYWPVGCAEACCCHWSHSYCWHFTPGTFADQIQAAFWEPRLLVVTDPRADHLPLTEAPYVNLPTIALCNTDSPLRYVDIATPHNNEGAHPVGLMCGRWPEKFCACVAPYCVNTRGRSCLSSTSTEILKRLKRKSRLLLKKL
ncbi:40S ribosomal protein SA [Sciurus carolinensis]|uniref:40S ribosomal protein SA n=1 Tax=Sciurus carolinensis TaxID=30640 RepID=A0AA41NEW2_SCICA|nr:40S ribosomal protein SA [Sciurus carolinensis]